MWLDSFWYAVVCLEYLLFLKKQLIFYSRSDRILSIGVWRSLVARTAGGREVAGSNPVAPIFLYNHILYLFRIIFLFLDLFHSMFSFRQ